MNISAQDVINALFSPDDIVCLRIFDDRKEGIFTGAKLNVEAGKFFSVEEQLAEHNQKHRGIFLLSIQADTPTRKSHALTLSSWKWTTSPLKNSRN